MAEELAPVLQGRASIRIIDIDGDRELKKRYGLRIPVLTAAGQELSEYPLNVAAVEAYLASSNTPVTHP